MTTRVLITDDSALARKQLARSLPAFLNAQVNFAENGLIALEQLKENDFDLMFLDLTMPEMDGFETLEFIRGNNITLPVFVVSGDIQPKAQQRVLSLGAQAFIKKPVSQEQLIELLKPFTLKAASKENTITTSQQLDSNLVPEAKIDRREIYMEVVNVAMGRAADSLARYFDVFVHMPLPQVNFFEVGELIMIIRHLAANEHVSGICQGFSGEGIAGEALMLISDSSMTDLITILDYPADDALNNDLEVLMDVSNVLVSAFLSGIGEQAGLSFAQSSPVIFGQHLDADKLVENMRGTWKRSLTIEVSYTINDTNIKCDLLLFLVDESLPLLDAKLAYLMDEE